ncbi:hypothetical protein RhiirC2_771796 [Rhizophagus irregularis]|uniref:Uncharacterized protein n=1 Tax=Rhizophagus irregularis TaxID=588596 RepID=A0A2N1NT06_9GLOM|nr:hypothetical protein RhiirC2_771796 [Rhizophagus irregularis]
MSVAYSDENMDFSWSICIILSDICDIAIVELYSSSVFKYVIQSSSLKIFREIKRAERAGRELMDMVLQDILWLINIVLKAFERFELIELRVILVVENILVTGNSVVKGDETYMKEVVETGKSYNLIVDIDPSENMTEILANGILKLLIDCKISCYCFEFYYSTRTLGNKTNKTIIYEMVTVFIEQNQFECLSLEQPLLRIPNAKWFSDNYVKFSFNYFKVGSLDLI